MNKRKTIILAIESSCDDTSAAVIIDGKVRSNLVANQLIHQKYGGVIPEWASRKHHENILPVCHQALLEAGINKSDLSAVAYTIGPGLLGSLLVGSSFAKGLAAGLDIPLIAVNHMEAHVLAHFIEDPRPRFPFLCLTISGGHTQIVKVNSPLDMEVVGQTIDDAVGEAFDKIGKYLGLDYPSGPIVDKRAQEGNSIFVFSKPQIPALDFSFSGFKTAVLYFLRDNLANNPSFISDHLNNICASVQHTIVDILFDKLIKAAELYHCQEIAIAGGVSANSLVRSTLIDIGKAMGWNTYIPAFQYCTDNAGMIAMAAHFRYEHGMFSSLTDTPQPRMKI